LLAATSLCPVTQSAPPGEPTSSDLETGYREVDGGSGLGWIGAFVFDWGYGSYGTVFWGGRGGGIERRGERSAGLEIGSRRLSESLSWADFTLIDSP